MDREMDCHGVEEQRELTGACHTLALLEEYTVRESTPMHRPLPWGLIGVACEQD